MLFINEQHQVFYGACIEKSNAKNDPYRKALFYALGLTSETRNHIDSLYDFKERGINFDGLFQGWQTSTSVRATRLAFNLYNGFTGDVGDGRKDDMLQYTPEELFCDGLMMYFFEAVKLRYPENTRQ